MPTFGSAVEGRSHAGGFIESLKKRVQRHFGVQAALPGEWAGRFGKLRGGQGVRSGRSGGYILAA